MNHLRFDAVIGLCLLGLALMTLLVWIPLDVDTDLVEKVRRRYIIGDSLAPAISMLLVIISCLFLIRSGVKSKPGAVNWLAVRGIVTFVMTFAIGLLVMRFAGPLLIIMLDSVTAADLNYRVLRNTPPVSYIGFVLGGTVIMGSLSHFMDGKLSRKRLALFFAIAVALALIFDVPFEDLLLPPNGDV